MIRKLLGDREEIRYLVRIPPAQVAARLQEFVGPESLLFDTTDKEFAGSVSPSTFSVRRVETLSRNSFRPYLHGKIEPVADGSRIVVRLGLDRYTKVFMPVWLAGTVFFAVVSLVSVLTGAEWSGGRAPDPRFLLLAPPGMFAAGVAMVWVGRLWGKSDERRLLEFADQLWGPRVEPASSVTVR